MIETLKYENYQYKIKIHYNYTFDKCNILKSHLLWIVIGVFS